MQPVSPDDEIEASRRGMPEGDVNAVPILREASDLIAEGDVRERLRPLEQHARKVAPPDRDETAPCQLAKHAGAEASHAPTVIVDNPHLSHVITEASELVRNPH